jgi:hypothetical protein
MAAIEEEKDNYDSSPCSIPDEHDEEQSEDEYIHNYL